MKQKAFFLILKGISLRQKNNFFSENENPTLKYIIQRSLKKLLMSSIDSNNISCN